MNMKIEEMVELMDWLVGNGMSFIEAAITVNQMEYGHGFPESIIYVMKLRSKCQNDLKEESREKYFKGFGYQENALTP